MRDKLNSNYWTESEKQLDKSERYSKKLDDITGIARFNNGLNTITCKDRVKEYDKKNGPGNYNRDLEAVSQSAVTKKILNR